jgi:hypothetical protein
MRNKILGAVGILLGGLMTLAWIVGTSHHVAPAGDAAYSAGYATGQWLAHIFGVVILVAGFHYLFKKASPSP